MLQSILGELIIQNKLIIAYYNVLIMLV